MGVGAILSQLELAGYCEDPVPELPPRTYSGGGEDWNYSTAIDRAREVIGQEGLQVIGERDRNGKHIFALKHCFFNPDHTNNDAAIMVSGTGQLEYHCFHNSCSDKGWKDVAARYNSAKPSPPAQEKRYQGARKTAAQTAPPPPEIDIVSLVVDFYKSGVEKGFSTGWSKVDELYTVQPGQWTLITGIPSHGKSSWLDA